MLHRALRNPIQPHRFHPVGGGIVAVIDAEAASFTENQTVGLVSSDTGTFVDDQQLIASVPSADTVSFIDAWSIAASIPDSETGIFTETQSLTVSVSDSDTASFTETQQLTASIYDSDNGQFLEVVSVIGVIPVAIESITFTDDQTVGLVDTDAGTWTETEQITILDGDTGQWVELWSGSALIQDADLAHFLELDGIGVMPMSGEESGVWVDAQQLTASIPSTDTGAWTEAEQVIIHDADIGQWIELWSGSALIQDTDTIHFADAQQLTASITDTEALNFLETASLHASVTDVDTGTWVDNQQLTAKIYGAESITVTEQIDLLASITGVDGGVFNETESVFLPPAPVSILDLESPSVVRVLRMVSTRVNGSLSVRWVPIADLTEPVFSLRPRTVLNHPVVGGDLVVRFDLHFVRPGITQQPPPQQGTMPDRYGVLFADPSAAEWLRAGDRVQCLSGPIEGMFEIKVTPDLAVGFNAAHHLEVEVVEVSQFMTGSNVSTSIDYLQFPSFMRSLYATRVEVKRLVTSDISGGSTRSSWVKTTDMVDPMLGTPGELMCRIDTAFLRKGKDQLPPPQQGSMPDRVGVLYADVLPLLKAGDRLHCVEGPLTGSVFELRVAPDLAPNLSKIGHIEAQVFEIDQVNTGSHLDSSFDFLQTPSYMRALYASQVDVLRLVTTDLSGGSAQSSWVKVSDMVDQIWGVPGELMCRIATSFLRPGKDQPPPLVAGRAPDRVGVLYCDATPYLKAGDRVRCITGDVYGTFELRVTPDLALNQKTVGHMEVQIIEVAQSLASYGRG